VATPLNRNTLMILDNGFSIEAVMSPLTEEYVANSLDCLPLTTMYPNGVALRDCASSFASQLITSWKKSIWTFSL